jgi:hypothetical protein
MRSLTRTYIRCRIAVLAILAAVWALPATLSAQPGNAQDTLAPQILREVHTQDTTQYKEVMVTDTLHLTVYFHKNILTIDDAYRENGYTIHDFCFQLGQYLKDSRATLDELVIYGSASPEGSYNNNVRLAKGRAHSIGDRIAAIEGLDSTRIGYEYIPEDWDGLAAILDTLDRPWAKEALDIVRQTPQWDTINGKEIEARKERFMAFRGGEPWAWLDKNVFPELRAAGGGISCVITHPAPVVYRDTVYVGVPVPYEVEVEKVLPVPVPVKPLYPGEGKKMILAVRTNVLAIPFTNVGVEVPIGEHWSVGADWYSPWIWRKKHRQHLDAQGWCFEFQAADIEGRYWFTNHKKQPVQRLLGHSIGVYVAAGHYDFERNWTGHQGEFVNVGADYLYAWPIFGGRMHLEAEIGIGFIYSKAKGYECLVHDDVIYHSSGRDRVITWFGPTRAQLSLVVPIYVHARK